MKPLTAIFSLLLLTFFSCGQDEDLSPNRLNHVGEKWKISSVEYTIVDQSISNPANWVQTGTASNAGAFYFNGGDGSFDIVINDKRQEDYFGYTMNNGSVSIISVDQSFSPSRFSQTVIAFSGEQSSNTMTISGTFTRQAGISQYVFTGDFTLTKE